MSIKVFKAGILDTIQDTGRYGYQHLGINPGGAMDKFAAQIANVIVGNDIHKAVIELHFPASVFVFQQKALITLSGANFCASINGEKIPLLQPILVNKGAVLQFHKVIKGARCFMAVHGGFNIPQWLGSCSTNLKAVAGGCSGRALRKDDEIIFNQHDTITDKLNTKDFLLLPWKADDKWEHKIGNEILLLPGNEISRMTDKSKEKMFGLPFTITNQSDRMGFRLKNEALLTNIKDEVISSAVSFGTVQLLPDGQLIILMADHQTTGGYPKVGHVISAHHSLLAQMKAGEMIRFRLADQQLAEELLIKQQQHLLQLQNACTFRLEQYLHANRH
ncbi:MAG: biotin-dependent carboxyltransferase family protein [Chitinophagaceae bacterium]